MHGATNRKSWSVDVLLRLYLVRPNNKETGFNLWNRGLDTNFKQTFRGVSFI